MEINYYFSRLNLFANFTNKKDYLLDSLTKGNIIISKGFQYGFFDVEEVKYLEFPLITGHLVKYEELTDEEVVDRKTKKILDSQVSNKVKSKVRFIYHLESNILIYHEGSNQINKSVFCNRFEDLIIDANDHFMIDVKVNPILHSFDFLEEIKKFSFIKKIKITLVPSNPHFQDRWKDIDDRIKRIGATKFKEEYETNKNHISLKIDETIENNLLMVEDGYGSADVSGIIDDKTVTISTENKKQIREKSDKSDEIIVIFVGILEQFKELLERFKV